MGRLVQVLAGVLVIAWGTVARAQDQSFRVTDRINLPVQLAGQEAPAWYLVFEGTWTVGAKWALVTKTVDRYMVFDHQDPNADADSLRAGFRDLLGASLSSRGRNRFTGITYEFLLREDPDLAAHPLQEALIPLIRRRSAMAGHYDLESQLNSLLFREEWHVDPVSLEITRKVTGITPVIWQRRRTKEGIPVNDAESGLPVFYKINLEQLIQRNPTHP
jgi:hypothetical protein